MSIKKHNLYIQGKAFKKERNYEGAAESFSELLKTIASEGQDDMSPECAILWYAYGDALLFKEEENPSDDLLGAAASEAKKAAASLASELNDQSDSEEEEEEDDYSNNTNNNSIVSAVDAPCADQVNGSSAGGDEAAEEEETDMQIAWEALEMCRKICEDGNISSSSSSSILDADNDAEDMDLLLADTYSRLGDLLRFNGQFNEAVKEYTNSLNLKKTISKAEDTDREISSLHFMLATTYIYNASDLISADKESTENSTSSTVAINSTNLAACIAEKKKALSHYEEASKILSNVFLSLKGSEGKNDCKVEGKENIACTDVNAPASGASELSELDEIKEMCDEVVETIDALKVEITSQEKELNSHKKTMQVTTTIGFGNVSNGNAAPVNVFGNAFTSSSSTASSFNTSASVGTVRSTAPATTDGMMQVKKKVKLETVS